MGPAGPGSSDTVTRVNHGRAGMLPADEYVASLARKRMAAGALFRDGAGGVLLVDPVYRDTWDLPGGAVEAEESPHAACRREVAEELGLDRPAGRVLAVDWVPSRPERPEGLVVVYDGGVLTPADIDAITVPDDELAGFAFVGPAAVGSGSRRWSADGSPRAWKRWPAGRWRRWKLAARPAESCCRGTRGQRQPNALPASQPQRCRDAYRLCARHEHGVPSDGTTLCDCERQSRPPHDSSGQRRTGTDTCIGSLPQHRRHLRPLAAPRRNDPFARTLGHRLCGRPAMPALWPSGGRRICGPGRDPRST